MFRGGVTDSAKKAGALVEILSERPAFQTLESAPETIIDGSRFHTNIKHLSAETKRKILDSFNFDVWPNFAEGKSPKIGHYFCRIFLEILFVYFRIPYNPLWRIGVLVHVKRISTVLDAP